MSSPFLRHTPRRTALWLIGACLFIGLLEVLRELAGVRLSARPRSLGHIFSSIMPYWITLGLFLVPLARIVRRFPLERGRWRPFLVFHLGTALLFILAHNALAGFLAHLLLGQQPTLVRQLGRLLSDNFLTLDFSLYVILVAATSAFTLQREAARQALRASELETSLTQARLDALRMQLNPHFLFNTLNATSVLALKGERDKVVTMLSRLSDLLRTVLEGTAQVVPLAEEVDLLSRYLEIEKVRFEDRLSVLIDIDPDVLGAEVPVLMLQPLAENAIRHGIARQPGPGRVEVRARAENARLLIEVRDSGPGFTDTDAQACGVGLGNTRARLAQLYGDGASLELAQAPEGGGIVRLILPLRNLPVE